MLHPLTPPRRFEERIAGRFLTIAHGGGKNSGAMALRMMEAGIIPAFQAFADTGGERPETYAHIAALSDYLVRHGGFPPIVTVRYRSKKHGDTTLEEECRRTGSLPSKAYGWSKCSEKWKARPQTAAIRALPAARERWKRGEKIIKCIGFDAGETRRVKYPADPRFEWEYPLVEWGMFRDDCEATLHRHGFHLVEKSSCFFCPSMRKQEILALREKHPHLLQRALSMESEAEPKLLTVNGLGRRLNWRDFLDTHDGKPLSPASVARQQRIADYLSAKMAAAKARAAEDGSEESDFTPASPELPFLPDTPQEDCGCYDG